MAKRFFKRFFKRLLRSHGGEPRKIVTGKLRSYGVAHRELIPASVRQAQRFLGAHAAVSTLFNLGRHLVGAEHYRNLRISAFAEWSRAVSRRKLTGFPDGVGQGDRHRAYAQTGW